MPSAKKKKFVSLRSLLALLAGLLTAGLIAACHRHHAEAEPSATPNLPVCDVYHGSLEPESVPAAATTAPNDVVGSVKGGSLTLRLSSDHRQVTRVELTLKNVAWAKSSEKISTQVTMESSELDYDGPFAIEPSGEFAVPGAGIRGRFASAGWTAEGTLQLVYRYDVAGSAGSPGTHIAGTPDIALPNGGTIKGTPTIDIPGTPAIEAEHYAVELGRWKWSLSGKTSVQLAQESRLIQQNLLRDVRYWQIYWQTNPNDERVQYMEWHDGNMKQIADLAWAKCTVEGQTESVSTSRSLIIPHAPPIFRDSGSIFAVQSDGTAEKLGEYGYMPVKMNGAEETSMLMIKDTNTNGQWIGVDGDKIIARGENEAAVQIGSLAWRDIVLETGVSAKKVLMTKGVEPGAAWEGEVDDVTYRQSEGGKAEPVYKLEYRLVQCEDGKDHLLLMEWPVPGNGPWFGVRDGTVYQR
ncbi:MAG TPA: hypothetical protein VMI53_04190 [Opitutaceae bacterium]|nr:hypothetical protein [Opitutaceae bacterium]